MPDEPEIIRLQADIELEKARLAVSLEELGDKVKAELDPGALLQRNALAACAGAALLGIWLAPRHRPASAAGTVASVVAGALTSAAGALLGRAAAIGAEALARHALFGPAEEDALGTFRPPAPAAPQASVTEVYQRTVTAPAAAPTDCPHARAR